MLYPSITDLPDAEASPLRVEAATAVALVSGILLAALGLLRLGALAHAIPPAVMVGFTAAAALAIGVSQAKELLGLKVPRYPYTWQTCSYVLGHLGEAQPASAVRCFWLWVCGFVVVGGGCLSTPPSLPDDTHASTKHPPKTRRPSASAASSSSSGPSTPKRGGSTAPATGGCSRRSSSCTP